MLPSLVKICYTYIFANEYDLRLKDKTSVKENI